MFNGIHVLMEGATPTITDGLTNIVDTGNKVMTLVTGNELLLTLFVGSLFFLGCGAVKAVKRVAKK